MNKKGNELLEIWIINLIFIGIILLIFLAGIAKISDNTIHTERSKARDFAFTYDSASQLQGKLNLIYNIPANYTIDLSKECKIQVKEKNQNIPAVYICNSYDKKTNLILKDKTYWIQKNV